MDGKDRMSPFGDSPPYRWMVGNVGTLILSSRLQAWLTRSDKETAEAKT